MSRRSAAAAPATADAAEPGLSLAAWARRGVTQPIAEPVPADDAAWLARKGSARIAWRVLKRHAALAWSGQGAYRVEAIAPGWRRAIWFHAEAPQIGDALMDLAPRSLLAERGIGLDLLAPPAIAALFRGDRWCARVFDDAAQIVAADYDFAIVDSDAGPAIAAKRGRAPTLPWLSMRGDYLAYDFQRALLATRRLAAMLPVRLDREDEDRHARQKLAIAAAEEAGDGAAPSIGRAVSPRVGLALGGVRAERSYAAWPAVARGFRDVGIDRFALFGSANAREAAANVLGAIRDADVIDLVAKTDLHGTQRAMRGCAVLLAADGGLMHLALTTDVPLVALFDASIDPAWRLPASFVGTSLRADRRDVSRIAPERVVGAGADWLALNRRV